jgi:hypothetical protein
MLTLEACRMASASTPVGVRFLPGTGRPAEASQGSEGGTNYCISNRNKVRIEFAVTY